MPETIAIDKSGANKAAIEGLRAGSGADIGLRQSKYLNNIVEQDHRAIKTLCILLTFAIQVFWKRESRKSLVRSSRRS